MNGYFSPEKVTRRYVLGLSLLAACVIANFVIMQVSLTFQQRQVRISALAAEQSRLFSDIGVYSRSLMRAAVANDVPEESINAIRENMRSAGQRLRANMHELLRLDDERIAGVLRFQVMTPYYRQPPHNLEQKIDRYIERTNELASLTPEHLAVRFSQWVPMDIAVTTGSLIQNSFDQAMAGGYSAAQRSVGMMQFAEKIITLLTLIILVLEGVYLFAPLLRVLQAQARQDRLTGLANRTLFYETLAKRLDAARAGRGHAALILFDLDRFKPINDTLGHVAGDALLQEVANRTVKVVGEKGFVARLGGDEFAILPSPDLEPQELEGLLERVVQEIEAPLYYGEWEMQPAASLGAAVFPVHGEDAERLFASADAALYVAKKQRSTFLIYDEAMRSDDDEARQMTLDLRRAVSQHELCVYYQPQIAMHENRCIGFEALLRWRHPTKGVLNAGQFVHMAERLGLVPEITAMVIASVAHDIRAWLNQGFDPGIVGINMPEEMFATDLAQQMLDRGLAPHAIPYERICIEVTEDVFLNRAADQISARLSAMRDLGLRIAFDDFGTGYASLSHLKRFPFDELKIDRSFVDDLTRDARSVEIIRALTGLARNLGKSVIAEGIETEEQRALLLAEGVPVGQGYLFSKAVPFDQATAFLRPSATRMANARDAIADISAAIDARKGRYAAHAVGG
ncbi:MAG TPA: EAL domain-containing protein [Caulobacterales bacterium]|nr:EAL domain-containing protein [Caulobacterales bacterium]